jgi:hypothetical protein
MTKFHGKLHFLNIIIFRCWFFIQPAEDNDVMIIEGMCSVDSHCELVDYGFLLLPLTVSPSTMQPSQKLGEHVYVPLAAIHNFLLLSQLLVPQNT